MQFLDQGNADLTFHLHPGAAADVMISRLQSLVHIIVDQIKIKANMEGRHWRMYSDNICR